MSIILEGPDGAGKTTLAADLQAHFPEMEMHPRFCTSTGGPIENLAEAVYRDTRSQASHYIYDRHPVISDYVYNAAIPERRFSPDFLCSAMGHVRERVATHSLTIWCIPPFSVVRDNVARDISEQMPGVWDNLEKIHELYQMHFLMWPGRKVFFDYTSSRNSWQTLTYALSITKGKLWLPSPK